MANLALALAFLISFLINPGGRALQLFIDPPILQSLPTYQGHLLLAFANYWVPATLIYFMARALKLDTWLRPNRIIRNLFGTANVLLILYVAARIASSTVEGGGASFVVASFSPFIILPAGVMIAIGFIWLIFRSFKQADKEANNYVRNPSSRDGIGLFVSLGIPLFVFLYILYISDNAPLKVAGEAETLFNEKCKSSGEKIYMKPIDVESVYFDPDGGAYFQGIVNGVYRGNGGGIIAEPMLRGGYLRYYEKNNDRQRIDGSAEKYRRYTLDNRKGEPVTELGSIYGVFRNNIVSEDENKQYDLGGTEVVIKNIKTNEIVSELTYYISKKHRKICGPTTDGNFHVSEFIRRSLNLSPRYKEMSKEK